MKKGFLPIGLKKYAAALLHIFFLCLFLAGTSLIRFNENYGRGTHWMGEESYSTTQDSRNSWNPTSKPFSNTSSTKICWSWTEN